MKIRFLENNGLDNYKVMTTAGFVAVLIPGDIAEIDDLLAARLLQNMPDCFESVVEPPVETKMVNPPYENRMINPVMENRHGC
ncbi:MAG: hypothetical protein WC455_12155 [Dehalococcoidia bacterium]|jgi:hypothetical protein